MWKLNVILFYGFLLTLIRLRHLVPWRKKRRWTSSWSRCACVWQRKTTSAPRLSARKSALNSLKTLPPWSVLCFLSFLVFQKGMGGAMGGGEWGGGVTHGKKHEDFLRNKGVWFLWLFRLARNVSRSWQVCIFLQSKQIILIFLLLQMRQQI